MRKFIVFIALLLILSGLFSAYNQYLPFIENSLPEVFKFADKSIRQDVKVVYEESAVIDVVRKASPSVVTVAATTQVSDIIDPFSFFFDSQRPRSQRQQTQNIGSGFIVDKEGIVVTNKHVVSDPEAKYTIITSKNKKYNVEKIFRDPLNDLAILKVSPSQNLPEKLLPLELGDSSKLQVGQMAIAIGTPLGEFNNTVTKGIVSGLGRGIVAGSPFEGFVERLDDVIQTDAAISPGNSGGPLLNSKAQVIGVNTAVSQNGENIGFALPVNLVKERLSEFNKTGQFNRPYLGVSYKMISRQIAIQNDVPEGAYINSVVKDSPAEKAGILEGDIITKINNIKIETKNNDLSTVISKQKIGDKVSISIYREDEEGNTRNINIDVVFENAAE